MPITTLGILSGSAGLGWAFINPLKNNIERKKKLIPKYFINQKILAAKVAKRFVSNKDILSNSLTI
jgi:hypothetical protein